MPITTKERTHLMRAIRRLVNASISDAWKGAGHPDDVPATEAELRAAKRNLKARLDDMAATPEAFAIGAARDTGFTHGTIAALACVYGQGNCVLWGKIVRAAGTQKVLQHALTNEGDWEWGGFARYAVIELGEEAVRRARRAVREAKKEGGK